MAVARDIKATVRERLQWHPSLREALLDEADDYLLTGDVGTSTSLLLDHATIGFVQLSGRTG